MSEKNIGFQSYMWEGKRVISLPDFDRINAQQIYFVDTNNIKYLKPKPDTRTKLRKIYDEVTRRLSNVWHALKGGEFD